MSLMLYFKMFVTCLCHYSLVGMTRLHLAFATYKNAQICKFIYLLNK